MNMVLKCKAWMKACLAIEFISQIQTNEFCHYIGEGSQPSENIELLGKNTSATMEHRRDGGRRVRREAELTAMVHRH